MNFPFFAKHKCFECGKKFNRYKSERRNEQIPGTKDSQIYWIDACPHCGFVHVEGKLIRSSQSSTSDLLEKIKGD